MTRKHALIVSAALGLASVLGTVAVLQTAHAGKSQAAAVSDTTVAKRTRQLDAFEASLRKQLAAKPPALPAVPAAPASGASAAAAAPPEKVVYVRPAPHVVTVPRTGSEHEDGEHDGYEHESGGEDD